MPAAFLFIFLLLAALPAGAQEFCALGGLMQNADHGETSCSWQLEYRRGWGKTSPSASPT